MQHCGLRLCHGWQARLTCKPPTGSSHLELLGGGRCTRASEGADVWISHGDTHGYEPAKVLRALFAGGSVDAGFGAHAKHMKHRAGWLLAWRYERPPYIHSDGIDSTLLVEAVWCATG